MTKKEKELSQKQSLTLISLKSDSDTSDESGIELDYKKNKNTRPLKRTGGNIENHNSLVEYIEPTNDKI